MTVIFYLLSCSLERALQRVISACLLSRVCGFLVSGRKENIVEVDNRGQVRLLTEKVMFIDFCPKDRFVFLYAIALLNEEADAPLISRRTRFATTCSVSHYMNKAPILEKMTSLYQPMLR